MLEVQRVNDLFVTVSAPTSQCGAALDEYICHDEYIMLRVTITKLYQCEDVLRRAFKIHLDESRQKWEKYATEIKLLSGMCGNCKGKKEPVSADALDMQKLKPEIDELKAEIEEMKSAAARV